MSALIGLVKLAFANLQINKLRSVLTVIGMIFGTGAVIATLSSNEGASQFIKKELESMGTNVVNIVADGSSGVLTSEHQALLKKYVDNFRMLSPVKESMNFKMTFGVNSTPIRIVGVDPAFFLETKLSLASGRLYDSYDNTHSALVGVIGAQIKRDLFGARNAINEYVHVTDQNGSYVFRVSAILRERGTATGSSIDSTVFVPIRTLEKLAPQTSGPTLLAGTLYNDERSSVTREQVKAILGKAFPSGLSTSDSRESIEKTQGIWKKQNLVGICLAMISLVTGGVGIMNIMLLSVAQRKKEIGLRKAVGATDLYILSQFLIEAVIVCLLGGIIGIMVGMFFGQQVAKMMGQWEAVLNLSTIAMALCCAVLTGVVFGLAPAIRASRLDPYEALRG
ncbi:MAG: ABC transporter permease [Deltaproteobacteria bacterium]|nr:ABC transporter permease [Deltaproteobacteria bacterium]MBI3295248.1 ABC transporter permease [Deltaproteobacteria bacterium]